MLNRTVRHAAQGVAALAVAAGSVGVAHFDKAVSLSVDGSPSSVHVLGATVRDALDKQGIRVGEHDVVVPGLDRPIADGDRISVRYGRQLVVTVDGVRREYWTTATTVDAALKDVGVRAEGAVLTASRSLPLGRAGLAMSVTMPKTVTVVVAGKRQVHSTASPKVSGVLGELDISRNAADVVAPGLDAPVSDGMTIVFQRITTQRITTTQAIAFSVVQRQDAALYEGQSKTVIVGRKGSRTEVRSHRFVDGTLAGTSLLSRTVVTRPVAQVVSVGTKKRPVATTPAPAPAPSAGNTSGAGLNLANAAMWDRIAQCESSGNWSINTGNGYYGGLQFNIPSWLANGGDDFAARPDLASRAEQITVANRYYAKAGLGPWGCAHAA